MRKALFIFFSLRGMSDDALLSLITFFADFIFPSRGPTRAGLINCALPQDLMLEYVYTLYVVNILTGGFLVLLFCSSFFSFQVSQLNKHVGGKVEKPLLGAMTSFVFRNPTTCHRHQTRHQTRHDFFIFAPAVPCK